MMGFAACVLVMTSCAKQEITENVSDGQGQLNFSPGLGKQSTRAAELMNSTLKGLADSEANGIALRTYQDPAGNGTYTGWFYDALWYNGTKWQIETTRFRNTAPTKFITYYPKSDRLNEVADAFKDADFKTTFPTFTYQVNTASNNQEDLIAGITDIAANQSDVTIGLRHILSQVNFGTRGYKGAKITIQNVKIEGLYNSATYTYGAKDDYPIGAWSEVGTDGTETTRTASYDYNNYKNGKTENNATPLLHSATPIDAATGDIYVFGDGGNWGPGKDATVFYPVGTNNDWSIYQTPAPTGLDNSLMLMPQDFTTDVNGSSKVTFEYKIQDVSDAYVAGTATSWAKGEFKLNFNTTPTDPTNPQPDKHYTGTWEQNYRYLYLIDFTDFLDGSALTFNVDVEMYPWENYDGEGGIINIMAAGQPTAANMNKIVDKQPWYIASQSIDAPNDAKFNPVKWAQVIRDEEWDLSTYSFMGIEVAKSFNLSFQNVIFNTKGTTPTDTKITLTLPEGFSAKATATVPNSEIAISANNPYTISKGDKSAQAAITITNEYFYATLVRLKAGVIAATTDKQKFVYGAIQAVDLKDMEPAGLVADNTITVKFIKAVIPAVGATTNGNWTWDAANQTATWTKVAWDTHTLAATKTAIASATADAVFYCSDNTDLDLTTFVEPTVATDVSTITVVFNVAANRTASAATANGVWAYDAKSKTATWTHN